MFPNLVSYQSSLASEHGQEQSREQRMCTAFMCDRANQGRKGWMLLVRRLALLLIALCFASAAYKSFGIGGYVNANLTNGFNFLANPLDTGNNTISNVITWAPDGAKVYLWDTTNQSFTAPSVYSGSTSNWSINYFLPVGVGFVMQVSTNYTLTFVGVVLEGSLTNFVAGPNKFSLPGYKVPLDASLSQMSFPRIDGASALVFTNQAFADAFMCYNGFGWFDPHGVVGIDGPVIQLARSFFVQNPGPATNWVFEYHFRDIAQRSLTAETGSVLLPSDIKIRDGTVTLRVGKPPAARYDVQFSEDLILWRTAATNVTGNIWHDRLPGSNCGYYRAISR